MKAVLISCLHFICLASFGQFQKNEIPKEIIIGKSKAGGITFSELSYTVNTEGDTLYCFRYQDKKYTTRTSWERVYFRGGTEVLTQLYATLKAAVDTSKGSESSFKLGESEFFVKTASMVGTKYLKIGIATSGVIGMTDLTAKQIDQLFDKKRDE